MIETRKREHSRKPDEQYELVERCSPGPYLEMFARHPRQGWTVWGDESDVDIVPRGIVHKGYGGGPITPPLIAYERLEPDTKAAIAEELRVQYRDEGLSIRQICNQTGYSITRVRCLLDQAGVKLRRQGR